MRNFRFDSGEGEDPRSLEISRITSRDKAAFYGWASDPEHMTSLDVPYEAARYIGIPTRILEASSSPSAIDLRIPYKEANFLDGLVVERRTFPVSNVYNMQKFWETHDETYLTGVDEYHAHNRDLVKSGLLGLNDYVLADFSLSVQGDDRTHLYEGFIGRDRYANVGIDRAARQRYSETARQLGFRLTKGRYDLEQVNYFTGTSGRYMLGEIKPEYRVELRGSEVDNDELIHYAVEFLYPEDIEKYVLPEYRKRLI